MYGFPADLDLSPALGQETTQLCVGPYDLQFSFGAVVFAVQSRVEIWRNSDLIGSWEAGGWPEPAFYQMLNTALQAFAVLDPNRLSLRLANGLELQLLDTSEQYESMQIYVGSHHLGCGLTIHSSGNRFAALRPSCPAAAFDRYRAFDRRGEAKKNVLAQHCLADSDSVQVC